MMFLSLSWCLPRSETMGHRLYIVFLGKRRYTCRPGFAVASLTFPPNNSWTNVSDCHTPWTAATWHVACFLWSSRSSCHPTSAFGSSSLWRKTSRYLGLWSRLLLPAFLGASLACCSTSHGSSLPSLCCSLFQREPCHFCVSNNNQQSQPKAMQAPHPQDARAGS